MTGNALSSSLRNQSLSFLPFSFLFFSDDVIDWSKQPVADYVGKVDKDGFKMIGTCHGVSHLKAEPDPPLYEKRYYPDWLWELPLKKVDISELDPNSLEYDKRIRKMRMRHRNYLSKQGIQER